jgi:hypothetical protein
VNTSVRPASVTAGKTALAIIAILSLLLSLIAIVRPVIAFHEGAENVGPEVTPTPEEFQPGDAQCPAGMTAIRFNDPMADDAADVLLSDGTTATVTIISSNGTLTFEVENGLAAIVKVKGGVSTPGTNDQNVYDYTGFPGGGIAHDDGLVNPNEQGISHVDFCLVPIQRGSILIYKDDQTGAPVDGATFSVKNEADEEVGVIVTDEFGFGCLDELLFGDYTVTETLAPAGWLADPDTEDVTVDSESTCDERLEGAEPADADATFTNTLLGSLLVLKTDGTDPLDDAVFSVKDSADTEINGPFTSGDDGPGLFCVDGLVFGDEYTVTETDAPDDYTPDPVNPQTHVIDNSDDCETRLAEAEVDPDLTFVNTLEETGSITVIKEVDCEDCETRTIGYYFNTADQHEEETNALFADLGGIMADGILFTNVDQVQEYRADDQDGTSDGQNGLSARGQLTLQYLGAQLNVARNGEECDLASRVYNNPDSPFDGWTVQEILDEADLAFAGNSIYSDEEIKSALDDINNSSHEEENPLSCEGTENGALDGVTFDLFLEEDYPDGDPIDSQTTAGGGIAVFDDLALDTTYVLVESGFPEGMTCEIVDVKGEGFEFTLNDDGSVTIVLTGNNPDVTLTVVNDCEQEEEEELGSLLIAKEDDEGASLGGATFEVDGFEHADTDDDGFVCVDDLTLGDIVSVEETVAPDGFIGEEGAHDVPILNTDDCETRLAGEDLQADADITFVNVPEGEDTGEIEVTKVDEEGATLPGATFKLYLDDGDDVFDPEDGAGNGDGGSGSCTGDANVSAVSNDGTGATAIANAITADGATFTAASFSAVTGGTPNGTAECLSWFATNGDDFGILTSGDVNLADEPNDDGGDGVDNGGGNVRGDTDFDVTVLKLDLLAPVGANCLRFDFAFYSEEFPEFVNTSFNDAFIAELNSSTWTTDGSDISAPNNFAFDPNGDVISINSTGATAMNEANADGTTYDGATVLLSAATPVGAGANSLYLSIFDQGDGILDSAVFLDNVRFQTVANVATDCVAGAQEAPAGGDVLIETKDTGGDGTALFSNLEAGTYWLQETEAPDGCDITEELTKVVLTEADILAGVPKSVEVENDCEQPSTGVLGSITIIKDAAPNNAQDFAFTTTGTGLSSFSLDDDADATLTNQKVFSSLAAGSYTVVETATTGWTLSSITCSAGGSGNTTTLTASITLTAAENVICTFVNTQQGGGTLPGNPARAGTLGGNPAVPNTAMDDGFTGVPAAAVLALLMLSGLAAAGYAARAEVRRRR